MNQRFGKYRATVTDNVDPTDGGRLQIESKEVGISGVWADACIPCLEPSQGVLTLPAVNTQVWIEFEAGDTDRPIWTGIHWPLPATPQSVILQSPSGSSVSLGADGSVEIVAVGALRISATSITISTGTAEVQTGTFELSTALAGFSGVVQCDTLIASGSVISPFYTPGVGNVW